MAHDRQQHIGEAARNVRADGFLDEGAGDARALAAAEGNREVIGPEPDQTFPERGRGGQRVAQLPRGLRHEQPPRLGFPRFRLVRSVVPQGCEAGGRRGDRLDSR